MSDKRAGARLVDRRSTRRVPSREGQAQKAPQAAFSNELEPQSPCVNLCSLDDAYGYCVGCYRTMDEIARWGSMSPAERWAVLRRTAERAGQRAVEVK